MHVHPGTSVVKPVLVIEWGKKTRTKLLKSALNNIKENLRFVGENKMKEILMLDEMYEKSML